MEWDLFKFEIILNLNLNLIIVSAVKKLKVDKLWNML